MPTGVEMIQFEHVTQRYDDVVALNDLTLTIDSHELFVLVGPSGSGKTTLLKMINRLNTPTEGVVSIDGEHVADKNLAELRRSIGYVLQTGALFPNMTVEQNAGIQLDVLKWDKKKKRDRVRDLLARVGLEPTKFASRMPSELSGGEAQRVGIVRALAASPLMMLMDEPFSALDPVSRQQLQELVVKLHEEIGLTIVFVTHDMREAVALGDRLAVMHRAQLQQVGKPEDVLAAPANDFVRTFLSGVVDGSRYMAALPAAGFGRRPFEGESRVPLSESDTVASWAARLTDDPDLRVEVGGLVLTRDDLVAYVATLGQGESI